MAEQRYDVVVVGAGPAGEVLRRTARRGRPARRDRRGHLVGGECSFYACMPSKALLRPDEALARRAACPARAEAATGELDALRRCAARRGDPRPRRRQPGSLARGARGHARARRGGARRRAARARRRRRVGRRPCRRARHGLGCGAARRSTASPRRGRGRTAPPPPRRTAPGRLLVLGAGPVGVELAQAWATLGSDVTLLEAGHRILPREEPFAAERSSTGSSPTASTSAATRRSRASSATAAACA